MQWLRVRVAEPSTEVVVYYKLAMGQMRVVGFYR